MDGERGALRAAARCGTISLLMGDNDAGQDVGQGDADDWPLSCIDHGIVDCEDCGHWQAAATAREDEHEQVVSALRSEVAQARRDLEEALHDVEVNQADRNMSRSELDDIAELLGFRRDSLSATHGDVIAEVKRMLAEGSPGVMHAVDRAFYELAVKERDFERRARDRIEAERDRFQVALGKVPQDQLARIMAAVAADEREG